MKQWSGPTFGDFSFWFSYKNSPITDSAPCPPPQSLTTLWTQPFIVFLSIPLSKPMKRPFLVCLFFPFFEAIAGLFSLTVNVQAWAEPSETLWACSFLQSKSTFGNKSEKKKKDDFLVTNSFKGQTQLLNQTPPDSAPPTSLHEHVTRSQPRFYHVFALFVCNVISSKVPLSVKSCISLVYMHFCSVCSVQNASSNVHAA